MTSIEDFDVTSLERSAMEQLKSRIIHDINTDMYNESHLVYRFLRARDWNVDEAEKMFRKWLLWRKENRMDMLLKEYQETEFLKEYVGKFMIGHDKESNSIFYFCLGKWDIPGFILSAKYSDIEKTVLKFVEASEQYAEEQSRKLNRRIQGFISIIDAEGFGFANATNKKGLQLFIRLSRVLQENYPERMRTAYVINAASYFTISYNIVKIFMSARLINKFRIFGADGWKEELLRVIDTEELPAFLGGNKTDPDGNPLCKTFVSHAGPIDEKHYINNSRSSLAKSPLVKKLSLSRASFEEIPIHVPVPNSIIEWEFKIKNRDIGFGLFYKDKDTITELVPLRRLETEDFTETGVMKCEKAGDYIVVFDNSYSWLRSKEILYQIQIISPEDQENCLQTID